MNWFYAKDGQQAGPVDDAELTRLVQAGDITDSTLVWHSELPNWLPYASVARGGAGVATAAPVAGVAAVNLSKGAVSAGPGQTQCSQCGRVLPAEEVVRIGNADVCAECKPVFLQRMREGAPVFTGTLPFAGFGIRLGAAILDGLILIPFYIVVFGAYFFLSGLNHVNFTDQQSVNIALAGMVSRNIALSLVMQALLALYSAFFVSRYGGTPGKRICKLRVVQGTTARPVTFLRALARYGAKAVPRLVPLLGLIYMVVDALFIVFDDQKRALHDMICDTRVVQEQP